MKDYPLVIVEWLDAWADDHDEQPEDWPEDCPVRTAGFLIRQDERVTSVASELVHLPQSPTTFRGVTHVPTSLVTKVVKLRAGR